MKLLVQIVRRYTLLLLTVGLGLVPHASAGQMKYLIEYGIHDNLIQYNINKLAPQYVYIRDLGTIYTSDTKNFEGNQNFGIYVAAHRGNWQLRTTLSFYTESIRLTGDTRVSALNFKSFEFYHRARKMMAGLHLGIPLLHRTRIKVSLMPGFDLKFGSFKRNFNIVDLYYDEQMNKSDKKKYADLEGEFALPKICYSSWLMFGNVNANLGVGISYQSAASDIAPGSRPYLFHSSMQYNLIFSKNIGYLYK
jgi:hypothetical protein